MTAAELIPDDSLNLVIAALPWLAVSLRMWPPASLPVDRLSRERRQESERPESEPELWVG